MGGLFLRAQEEPTLPALGFWTSGLRNWERARFCHSRCRVCGLSLRQPQGSKAWFLAPGLSHPIAAPALTPDPHAPARREVCLQLPENPASIQRSREQDKRGPGLPPQSSQQQPQGSLVHETLHSPNLSLTKQWPPGQVDSSLHPVRTCSVTLGTSLSLCWPQQPQGPRSAPSRMAMSSRRLSRPSSEAFPSQSRHNYTTPSPPTAPLSDPSFLAGGPVWAPGHRGLVKTTTGLVGLGSQTWRGARPWGLCQGVIRPPPRAPELHFARL